MANTSPRRVGILRAMQFAATAAIVLWPPSGWAQSDTQAVFTPTITQKVDARSEPARVTTEDESALTSKGYVKVGTIQARHPGKKNSAEITEGLRAAALSKAAGAGGDVVHFEREGLVETAEVRTGKMERVCEQTQERWEDHGAGNQVGWVERCVKWGSIEQEKRVTTIVSHSTVWRYDPKLAADIARANEAAREATRKAEAEADALAKYRVEQGADVNTKDDNGNTPLLNAALLGKMEQAELLLAHGADVNAKDSFGRMPLHWAAQYGYRELAELLLAHGADVNAKNSKDQTPLHFAAENGQGGVAELLLAHSADVNAKDSFGATPLKYVAMIGQVDVAELLLAHGANVNARDNSGGTPLHWAAHYRHQELVKVLREHGGHE